MSALAKLLLNFGLKVCGSDVQKSEQTDCLQKLGATIFQGSNGDRKEIAESDVVVYTDAISENDPELISAKIQGKKLYRRAEFLAEICKRYETVISVAGSHGKTTCTSMCAHVLRAASAPFTAHIGGEDGYFSNFHFAGRTYFLTEICEYKKNLLKAKSTIAVLLNVDNDHLDCYQSEQELSSAFSCYLKNAATAIVCADDVKSPKAKEYITFGIEGGAGDNGSVNYLAKDLCQVGEKYSFNVYENGKNLCRVRLNVVGRCHVYNALAACAAARQIGVSGREIAVGLSLFQGVKRRFERLGEYRGAEILCDYAHHPREIASTLQTFARVCKGNAYVIFQPHTYSRTKHLFQEFVSVFKNTKNLLIYKTYAAREKYDPVSNAKTLAENLPNSLYVESLREIKTYLDKTVKKGDCVLFLGAGDIYCVAKFLATQEIF